MTPSSNTGQSVLVVGVDADGADDYEWSPADEEPDDDGHAHLDDAALGRQSRRG